MADSNGNKTGGREKGTLNKRSLRAQELAEELGCDPLKILLHFAMGDARALGYVSVDEDTGKETVGVIEPEMRLSAAKEASSYLFPKLKAIEHTGKDGADLETYEQFITRVKVVDA
jgi:hypothetical protein